MTRMVLTGFDSAWTRGNRGAIAHLIVDGLERTFPHPQTVSFSEALTCIEAVGSGAALHVIAIDQPLIVPNATGSRPVEGVFRPILGRMGGAIQPSSRGRVGMFDDGAPIWQFLRALNAPIDPMLIPGALAGRLAFEAYPVAAQIGFATESGKLKRLHKYNPGRRKTFTNCGWRGLHQIMEGAASSLGL